MAEAEVKKVIKENSFNDNKCKLDKEKKDSVSRVSNKKSKVSKVKRKEDMFNLDNII